MFTFGFHFRTLAASHRLSSHLRVTSLHANAGSYTDNAANEPRRKHTNDRFFTFIFAFFAEDKMSVSMRFYSSAHACTHMISRVFHSICRDVLHMPMRLGRDFSKFVALRDHVHMTLSNWEVFPRKLFSNSLPRLYFFALNENSRCRKDDCYILPSALTDQVHHRANDMVFFQG